jgi:hypothetical protein
MLRRKLPEKRNEIVDFLSTKQIDIVPICRIVTDHFRATRQACCSRKDYLDGAANDPPRSRRRI